MLEALLWALAVLVAALLAVALAPVDISVVARSRARPAVRAVARPLAGLGPAIPLRRRPKEAKPAKPKPKPTRRKRRSPAQGARILRALPSLLGGILRAISVRKITLDADFGFDDPADTGQVYGALTPFLYALPPEMQDRIALRPDFTGPRAEGRLATTIRVRPAALLGPAIRFGWHAFGPAR